MGGMYNTHFAGMHAALQGSSLIDFTMYEATNRFYGSNLGRWHSPDPIGEKAVRLDDPQTWNMYAYVRDNPTTLTDPSGEQISPNGKCMWGGGPCEDLYNTQELNAEQGQGTADVKARAAEAAEAAANLGAAAVKVKAMVATATTAETGAGALATAYLAISASGNLVAGSMQALGAATGETEPTEAGAEAVAAVTSVSGFVTLLATGSTSKAATAAAVEGIITSNPKDLAKGSVLERAAKAFDLAQSVKAVGQAALGWISDKVLSAISD